jgi:hypothetical protein
VVGATGFEPATPCAQGRCATRLRYAPTSNPLDFTPFSSGSCHACFAFWAKTVPKLYQNSPGLSPNPRAFTRRSIDLLQGLVRLQLRQPWRDGTTDVVFDPVEFLGRLAVLVPRPRINLILYHGVLGPRAAWRADVVRRQMSGDSGEAGVKDSASEQAREGDPAETARRQARGQTWAALMARTFGFDVLACPRCGGRLRLIALIEEAGVIQRILRHVGVPTEIPAPRPARAPPIRMGPSDQAGWDNDPSVFDPCS